MFFITAIYVVLLLVFFGFSALIVRHVIKFGYLSPNFRIVSVVFGIVALATIALSVYFLMQYNNLSASVSAPAPSTSNGINF